MPKYDAENFDPPAPVAYVTLRNSATGVSLSDIPMLIDTGADVTLVPSVYANELDVEEFTDALLGLLEDVAGFETAKETSIINLTNDLWSLYHD